jgi:hypothetical protein
LRPKRRKAAMRMMIRVPMIKNVFFFLAGIGWSYFRQLEEFL